ncbi:MAG: hypothetical protein KDD58_04400 [Bdellovibrionales bacterium]|nr:hypothetical protein [Bdellovibrionales bacterium]
MGIFVKFLYLNLVIFSFSNLTAANPRIDQTAERWTYRLINPAVFTVDDLRKAATQAFTGEENERLDSDLIWIGPGAGRNRNLEISFSAKDPNDLEMLKEIIVQIDQKYNATTITPIRVTAQIYAVSEDVLKDLGIGVSGFWNGKAFTNNSLLGNSFLPTPGQVTGFVGSLPNLLRIQLNAAIENEKAMRIEDRYQLTYHGLSFNFSDTQDYHRDGPVNTALGKLGFELSGNVYLDEEDANSVVVSDLNLYIGFAPTDEQNQIVFDGDRTPFGVRKIELPISYDKLINNTPKILYSTIVYANYRDSSFGLFTGVKNGGEASRLLVILTAEVDPKIDTVPEFATDTPDKLKDILQGDKKESWHNRDEKEDRSNQNDNSYLDEMLWYR